MNDYLVVILSSTVLAGILTSIISVIINNRNNRLKYITEDRRIWRKEIREIVDEIYAIKYPSEIKGILAKLKVRINPYGRGKKEDYVHDSHIWEVITRIEENPSKELEKNKERLVLYLSLMLKYDWDRSKGEVLGNLVHIILFITYLYGLSFLIYNHFVRCRLIFNELFFFAFCLFLIFPTAISILTCEESICVIKNKIKFQEKTLKRYGMSIFYILIGLGFVIGTIVMIFTVFDSYGITLEYLTSPSAYIEVFSVVAVVYLIVGITRTSLSESITKKYSNYIRERVLKEVNE